MVRDKCLAKCVRLCTDLDKDLQLIRHPAKRTTLSVSA